MKRKKFLGMLCGAVGIPFLGMFPKPGKTVEENLDIHERQVYGKDIYLNHYEHTAILVAFQIVREGKERAIAETEAYLNGQWSISKEHRQRAKRRWYECLEKSMEHLEEKIGTNQIEIFGYSKNKKF